MNDVNERALASARGWIGTPYVHQASRRGAGCDCLGLLRGVWREVIGPEPLSTPAYSSVWAEPDGSETLLDMARLLFLPVPTGKAAPGNVLLFRMRRNSPAKHCGIMGRQNRFIHAYEHAGVIASTLNDFWASRIAAAFRFPDRTGE